MTEDATAQVVTAGRRRASIGVAPGIGLLLVGVGLGNSNSVGKLIPALLVTMLAAMLFCALLNTFTERIAYRPLRNAPRLAPLITAIGMSFIFQNVGLNRLGPAPVSVPNILPTG